MEHYLTSSEVVAIINDMGRLKGQPDKLSQQASVLDELQLSMMFMMGNGLYPHLSNRDVSLSINMTCMCVLEEFFS